MLHRLWLTLITLCLIISGSSAQLAPITPQTALLVNSTQVFGSGRPLKGAFSPDGRLVALIGTFGVQLYDLAAPDIPDTLGDTPFPASDLAFSADSRYLAVTGGYSIRLYDLSTRAAPQVIYPDNTGGPLSSVAFHPDGGQIAVGAYSDEGRVLIFSVPTLAPLQVLEDITGVVTTLAYESNRHWLAAGSRDGSVLVWDSDAGYAPIHNSTRDIQPITQVVFQDGLLITAVADSITVTSLSDGVQVREVMVGSPITSLSPAPEGGLFVGHFDGETPVISRISAPSGQLTRLDAHLPTLPVTGLALSPDDASLLSVSANDARLVNLATQSGFGYPFMESVYALAVTPDGAGVALGGSIAFGSIYETTGALYANFFTLEAPIHTLAFSPDGNTLIVGTDGDAVYVMDGLGETRQTLTDVPAALTAAQFSPDGAYLALGFANGALQLYAADDFALIGEMTLHGDVLTSLDFSPDGAQLVTGGRDTLSLLWSIPDLGVTGGFTGHTAAIESVDISPDGTRVVIGDAAAQAWVWDIAAQTQLFSLPDHYGAITTARYSPDGSVILTTSTDQTARLYDADGALLTAFYDHNAPVYTGAWLPDGAGFITAGGDGFAILYQVVR